MKLLSLRNTPHLLNIGVVANLLEWYDFSVYIALSTIMGQLFFHEADPITHLIQVWGTFALSYLARPLGSFFWGYVGDRYGHSYSLQHSLLVMALPTVLIGLLPTYHQVGFIATAALITLRFIQGFAVGGELPISACYIFEHSPLHLRSFLCSTVSVGVGLGLTAGSVVFYLLGLYFTPEQILVGAWRIPYLLSVPLTFWILRIRRSIDNTTQTLEIEEPIEPLQNTRQAFKALLGTNFLRLILLVGFMEASCYILLMWLSSYLQVFLHVPTQTAEMAHILLLASLQCFLLLMGYIAGRIGYKRVLSLHTILIILLTYPLFQALQTQSTYLLFGIHIIFAWLYSGVAAVMMEVLGNAYPKAIRCSGMSITHTIGATFFGGFTPMISTWATNYTGLLLFPAYYIIVMGIIVLPIIWMLPSSNQNISITENTLPLQ